MSPSQFFSEQIVAISCLADAWKADPANQEALQSLRSASFKLAQSFIEYDGLSQEDSCVIATLGLALQLQESGAMDYPASLEALDFVGLKSQKGWKGLASCLLVAAPWQWSHFPRLEKAPTWLWTPYARIALTPPQGFCASGQSKNYAEFMTDLLEQCVRQVNANRGSLAVKGLLSSAVELLNCIPLLVDGDSLRRFSEARGRLLAVALGTEAELEFPAYSREGMRLRIGFLNRSFGAQSGAYSTVPTFENLDPEEFEVFVFACHSTYEPLEEYVKSLNSSWVLLPDDFQSQLEVLRSYNLDVLVYGTNLSTTINEVTRLAAFRCATMQVVNNSSFTTTGIPTIDLFVSGTLSEGPDSSSHYSERLALLPGSAHALNYHIDAQDPTVNPSRASLGIPDDAFLFVSGANYHKITPEMIEAWAGILSAVPGSYLLLHPFNPNWSSDYPIKRFDALFDELLNQQGVEGHRLVISANRFQSRSDVVQLLSLGDLYLDTHPFCGVNSVIDALEQSLPVLEWESDCFRSRRGAALLRELGLDECIAHSKEEYQALAVSIANDRTKLQRLAQLTNTAMSKAPRFLDVVAASEDFGALIKQAYAELVEAGSLEAFKQKRDTIQLSKPAPSTMVTHVQSAETLRAQGRSDRAVTHLMAAIEDQSAGGAEWFLLAHCLRESSRESEAIKALETALRLSPQNVEAWLMLVDISAALGATDMVTDALEILQQIAASDPRVLALKERYNQPE